MVIVVVVVVVLAAVIGGYLALRPSSKSAATAPSSLKAIQQPVADDVDRTTPVETPPPMIADADQPDEAGAPEDQADQDEVDDEYEIIEVIEYIEIEVLIDDDEASETAQAADVDAEPALELVAFDRFDAPVAAPDDPPQPAQAADVDAKPALPANDEDQQDVDQDAVEQDAVETPLAEVVAELIDEADPDVADVMARLIDASDPDLVSRLIDAPDLEVAQVVAQLVEAAEPEIAALVSELADAPERRDVSEVLRLVDTAYGATGEGGEVPPEVAARLEELDIEKDLDLTSRPGEMSGFGSLGDQDKLRVIIRVLCGLVGRDDLPPPRRGPRNPASVAEQRMWPLSRARWPVPPPVGEEDEKDHHDIKSLPARRQSSRAS